MNIPESAAGLKFDPLLNVGSDGSIVRNCHYFPEQYEFHGGWACSGCGKRTKCNAAIFERLAAYEMSRLSPEVVMHYKKFEDEVIAAGLTFADILNIVRDLKGGGSG